MEPRLNPPDGGVPYIVSS